MPVVRPGRKLAWVHWDPTVEHPLSPMGIPEPEGEEQDTQAFIDADLRLIPALAFDAGGHRLGQGGGYYDRIIPLLSDQQLTGTEHRHCLQRRNLRSYPLRPVGRYSTGDSHRAGHFPRSPAGLKAPGSPTPDSLLIDTQIFMQKRKDMQEHTNKITQEKGKKKQK